MRANEQTDERVAQYFSMAVLDHSALRSTTIFDAFSQFDDLPWRFSPSVRRTAITTLRMLFSGQAPWSKSMKSIELCSWRRFTGKHSLVKMDRMVNKSLQRGLCFDVFLLISSSMFLSIVADIL